MTSEKNHIGSNFNDFLEEENVDIKKDEIMQRIMNIKLMQKWDESSEDYKKTSFRIYKRK